MHKKHSGRIGSAVVASVLFCAIGVSGQNTLNVNVGQASSVISKALYGTLMENYGRCIYGGVYVGTNSSVPNINGMRKDVVEGFKECGIGCIEFPGGCFADQYKWEDGVGPKSSRPGGESRNGMGTDEFFQLCSLTGAYPYPTANIQSASAGSNKAWQTYIYNKPTYWSQLKHWKIGNEEWNPCGNMTQSSHQTKWDQYYQATESWAKSALMHIMDGGSGGAWIADNCKYMVKLNGPVGISYHRYTVTNWNDKGPSSNFSVSQYYNQIKSASDIAGNINNFVKQMDQTDPSGKVALCVDEWGAWYNGVAGMGQDFTWSTVRDAVIAGTNLNIFNNYCKRVKMALVAQPVNVIQSLMLTENGGQNRMRKTPVFWVFKMLKPHHEAKMAPSTMQCATNQQIPVLNASASIDSKNVVHISIVNTHDNQDQNLTINLTGAPEPFVKVTGEIVNGATINSGITSFTSTDTAYLKEYTGATLSGSTVNAKIPAHSVVMLRVAPNEVNAKMSKAVFNKNSVSLSANASGKIRVKYSVANNTPVQISLLSIDGRTLVDSYKGNLQPGSNSLLWQPESHVAKGSYIVKLDAGEVSKSQRIIF